MRVTMSTAATAAVLSLGLLLSACGTPEREAAPAPSPSATPTVTATADPTPEPTQAAVGTRERPATPDVDTVTLTEAGAPVYEVMLHAANFAAWDAIVGHYRFNEPAPEGSTYVLLPVTATYLGSGPLDAQAWLDLDVQFVAADGRTFGTSLALLPEDLSITPVLATGAGTHGNLSFLVPEDAITGGTWSVVYKMGESRTPSFYTAA